MKKYVFVLHFVFCSVLMANPLNATKSNVAIPHEIFELVKKDYGISGLDFSPEFFDVEVFIQSGKNEQKVRVGYSQEVLDLSSYVDKSWNEFTFGFLPPFEIDSSTNLYFISRYKEMNVGTQQLGMGCHKAAKIQKNLAQLFSKKGILLMTKAGHYLNLLGGDYLLLKKEGSKIKIVFFKVRDGRWSHRLCNMSL